MTVKFIVAGGQIYFGDEDYDCDYHKNIVKKNKLSSFSVEGGGIADLDAKVIYGTSYGFGSYDTATVQKLLPDWTIEEPSNY